MKAQSILYKSSDISYYTYGSGNKLLFCFHGYGENGLSFSFLEKILGNEFTLIAIDLPFHGGTNWGEGLLFTHDDILQLLEILTPVKNKTFSIMAYSMGGRLALNLLQLIPGKIDKIILLAPDGLHVNSWYWFSTQTIFGNYLFKYTMQNPGWIFALLKIIAGTGLLNKGLVKFVHYFLDNKEERTMLYKRWTTMRKFKTNLLAVKKICDEQQKNLHILFGKYDRVILAERSKPLAGCSYIKIKSIDAGHQLLKPAYANDIAGLLTE